MVWYMNYCMPFLSNDSAVNFNRYIMAAELVLLLVFYTVLKVIASCQGVNVGTFYCEFRERGQQRRQGPLRRVRAQPPNRREGQRGRQGVEAVGS